VNNLSKIKVENVSFKELEKITEGSFVVPIVISIKHHGYFPVKIKSISYEISNPYENKVILKENISGLVINPNRDNIILINQKIKWEPKVRDFTDYYSNEIKEARFNGEVIIKDLGIVDYRESLSGKFNMTSYVDLLRKKATDKIINDVLTSDDNGVNILDGYTFNLKK
ncbi:MAG: hypothetical protein WC867_05795, partial [Candidatus Pacearchaeota archaeon]